MDRILTDKSSKDGDDRRSEQSEADELESLADGGRIDGHWRRSGSGFALRAGTQGQSEDKPGEWDQKPFPIRPPRESSGGSEQRLAGMGNVFVEVMRDHGVVGYVVGWR